jgi:hypothetical protein
VPISASDTGNSVRDVILGIASDTAGLFSDLSEGAGLDLRASETVLASQATVDLGTIATLKAAISGSASISSFGTIPNVVRRLRFTGGATLVHNATSLILPTGANIVTQGGDTAWAFSDASGNWSVGPYQRASGYPLLTPQVVSGNSGTSSIPAGSTRYFTGGIVGAAASLVYVPAGRRGRFRNLRIITPGAPGSGESYTFTLQKLFSDTALTCTIGPSVNQGSDLANSVLFEANERWSIKAVTSAGAAELGNILFSILFETME